MKNSKKKIKEVPAKVKRIKTKKFCVCGEQIPKRYVLCPKCWKAIPEDFQKPLRREGWYSHEERAFKNHEFFLRQEALKRRNK